MDSPLAPLLRDEAERLAREAHKALFGREPEGERLAMWTAAHLALLLDLRRPASMDALARIVAGRVGLKVGATAPVWRRAERATGSFAWVLIGERGAVYVSDPAGFSDDVVAPGISALTDSAEALTLAAFAVAGATP